MRPRLRLAQAREPSYATQFQSSGRGGGGGGGGAFVGQWCNTSYVEIAINLLNLSYLIFAFPRALSPSIQDAMAKGNVVSLSLSLLLSLLLIFQKGSRYEFITLRDATLFENLRRFSAIK